MYVLGISGGFYTKEGTFLPYVPKWFYHDAAAALFKEGKLLCAVEEERLNRKKHTTMFPYHSISFCLEKAGISFSEIEAIGYYYKDDFVDNELNLQYISHPHVPCLSSKQLLGRLFSEFFDKNFSEDRIQFLPHHLCHAFSAYYHSGFDSALTVIIDGRGEKESTSIFEGKEGNLHFLSDYHYDISLGSFYLESIKILGYDMFDEYKVMGLAPYGDPSVFQPLFSKLYTLEADGAYSFSIPLMQFRSFFLKKGIQPRRKNEPFSKIHKDFAAALQEALENIVFHLISHWKYRTGLKNLCMAGGVAHNCTLNGKIASSNLFDKMFVHPAAFDAGAAVGAGMCISKQKGLAIKKEKPIRSIYWGPGLKTEGVSIKQELDTWSDLVKIEYSSRIEELAAELIAKGNVMGWVQGEMEFGPRALGSRSILADPRPAENKSRINAMIKKREAYRPFAPSILEEEVGNYFELSDCEIDLSFMTYNLKVKKEHRKHLGAITHVNGTGRVQTVSKEQNERYWKLIRSFQEFTGIPIILNTSFNNNHEPIVCSIEDSMTCFLTTGLDYLVIGDYIIEKKPQFLQRVASLSPSLVTSAFLVECMDSHKKVFYEIRHVGKKHFKQDISQEMYQYLLHLDNAPESDEFISELYDIWSRRLIRMNPGIFENIEGGNT